MICLVSFEFYENIEIQFQMLDSYIRTIPAVLLKFFPLYFKNAVDMTPRY